MHWTFEISLMMFFVIVMVAESISIKTRHRITLQFTLGMIFIAGFALNIFPKDFIEVSKMKDVGFIAFNVLIIHSGSTIDLKQLKKMKNIIGFSLLSVAVMALVVGVGLQPIIGKPLALLAPGPIVGGGATSAIASVSILESYPYFAAFPWLLFMIQGFFGTPLLDKMIRRESKDIVARFRAGKNHPPFGLLDKEKGSGLLKEMGHSGYGKAKKQNNSKIAATGLVGKIDSKYKKTAYFMGTLMLASVFNHFVRGLIPILSIVHPAVSALALGVFLGHVGLIDRNPLARADAFGLLMLGLMSLLGHALAQTPIQGVVTLMLPAVLVFAVGTFVLWCMGKWVAPYFGMNQNMGRIITLSTMTGFPVSPMLVEESVRKYAENDMERALIKKDLMPAVMTTAVWIVNVASIFLTSLLLLFLNK